ncbi:hypothetical protein QVD17_17706 [Tagetes erecta]|uniref:Uncharacterized protein n=1 Tax=Tagetes erecta TaxID=13708 RepID=A0AAD8P1S5_TARER|nr:hypothetical protein QVD17_17706 [Tagetes erecta]
MGLSICKCVYMPSGIITFAFNQVLSSSGKKKGFAFVSKCFMLELSWLMATVAELDGGERDGGGDGDGYCQ